MTTAEKIKEILGDEDFKEFSVDVPTLVEMGWDFYNDQDYDFFTREDINSAYSDEELESYENWCNASEVHFVLREDYLASLSGRMGTDWSQADAYNESLEYDLEIADLYELYKKGEL